MLETCSYCTLPATVCYRKKYRAKEIRRQPESHAGLGKNSFGGSILYCRQNGIFDLVALIIQLMVNLNQLRTCQPRNLWQEALSYFSNIKSRKVKLYLLYY